MIFYMAFRVLVPPFRNYHTWQLSISLTIIGHTYAYFGCLLFIHWCIWRTDLLSRIVFFFKGAITTTKMLTFLLSWCHSWNLLPAIKLLLSLSWFRVILVFSWFLCFVLFSLYCVALSVCLSLSQGFCFLSRILLHSFLHLHLVV